MATEKEQDLILRVKHEGEDDVDARRFSDHKAFLRAVRSTIDDLAGRVEKEQTTYLECYDHRTRRKKIWKRDDHQTHLRILRRLVRTDDVLISERTETRLLIRTVDAHKHHVTEWTKTVLHLYPDTNQNVCFFQRGALDSGRRTS